MFQGIALAIIAALVGLDQLTKWLALTFLKDGEPFVLINGVFDLTYLENRGAAFGMMEGGRWLFVAFTVVVILCLLGVLLFGKYRRYHWFNTGVICIVSGGIGNLIDRVFNGFVVDMLHFHIDAVHFDFPVFNVADCYVVIGSLLVLFFFFFLYDERSDAKPAVMRDDDQS